MLSLQRSDFISIADYLQSEIISETKQEYVLIKQDIVDVEVCRRSEGWVSEHYFMGDEVTFPAIDLTQTVNEIYERVVNEDVRSFVDGVANTDLLDRYILGKKIALLIGVSVYENEKPLPPCMVDIDLMSDIIEKSGYRNEKYSQMAF
jgi:hypothetical protein